MTTTNHGRRLPPTTGTTRPAATIQYHRRRQFSPSHRSRVPATPPPQPNPTHTPSQVDSGLEVETIVLVMGVANFAAAAATWMLPETTGKSLDISIEEAPLKGEDGVTGGAKGGKGKGKGGKPQGSRRRGIGWYVQV